MASMNVSVPDRMRDWVQSRIEQGDYASVSDYVRDLIRRDQAANAGPRAGLAELDSAIARSLEDVHAGRTRAATEVFDRLEAKYAAAADVSEHS